MATVLILDPDPATRSLLELLLLRLGHRPIDQRELDEGAELDLLLLEPVSQTGAQRACELRERFPKLPILCVSIDGPSEESRRLEPIAHVMKPFRRSQLEEALALAGHPAPTVRAHA